MNLAQMMEGLREGYKKKTKFYGIRLTMEEVKPILDEYDDLVAKLEGAERYARED